MKILLTVVSFIFICTIGFSQDPIFEVLRKKDHSSFEGIVTSIYRDSEGYLWFGSSQGLIRYDGNEYIRFDYDVNDTTSLSHSDIEVIFEDNKQSLWFGSKYGLNLYHKETKSFTRYYPYQHSVSNNVVKNRIKGITQENDSTLWIASYGGGVCKLNTNTGVFTNYVSDSTSNTIPSNIVNYVFVDSKKRLWIGTESGGLSLMDTKTGICKNYLPDIEDKQSLSDATVSSIIEDKKGFIWVGTWRGGLNRFDPESETFLRFTNNIPSKTIRMITNGKDDDIWLATYKGVVKLNTTTFESILYLNDPFEPKSLLYDVTWSICYDQENILWIGTMGKGVCYTNLNDKPFYMPSQWDARYRGTYINALQKDSSLLWIGTEDVGLLQYDLISSQIKPSLFNNVLTGQIIYTVFKDKKGLLWLGTNFGLYSIDYNTPNVSPILNQSLKEYSIYNIVEDGKGGYIAGGWNTGIIHFNPVTKEKYIYKSSEPTTFLPSDIIWKIYVDSKQRTWVLTNAGMGIWDIENGVFNKKLDDPNVFAISEDADNNIICGSSFGEIFIFDEQTKMFSTFFKFKEEPYRIAALHFSGDFIWVSTQNGLIRLHKHTKHYRRFVVQDGLPSNYFTWAHATLPNGEIIIGTANGPLVINPNSVEKDSFKPNLVITHLDVFEKRKNFLNNTVYLDYTENKITIGFTALTFAQNGIVTYKYKLSNIDEKEVITTENKAVYTNLNSGKYIFNVTYQTADGLQSEIPIELHIHIATPWWKSWWFKSTIVLLLFTCVFVIYYYRIRSVRMRNKLLEEQVQKRTFDLNLANNKLQEQNITLQQRKEELEKLNEIKIKLFSVIGHDLKNPLSVIIQFSELLNDKYDKYDSNRRKEFIDAINKSSRNAHQLLVNLLDWARSQQQSIYIKSESIDINNILEEIIQLQEVFLKAKQIKVCIDNSLQNVYVYADINLLNTSICNILSNAIKFSHNLSEITIKTRLRPDNYISISVIDHGIGMSKERLERIFSIRKSSHLGTNNETGTGLGLIIVKEFIGILGGSIHIHSHEQKGTEVELLLPSTTETPISFKRANVQKLHIENNSNLNEYISIDSLDYLKNKQILIIDDDNDLRLSLKMMLEEYTTVHEAVNGETGLHYILELQPDLIICDVEMPKMDGIKVCEAVKQNALISHIPFILLTGLDSDIDMIKGLQAGADEYISKPYNKQVLLLKINQVFKLRKHLQAKFLIDETTKVDVVEISSLDDKLLNKIIDLVHENIEDPDFSVEKLSDIIGLHRSNLNKKMNILVGTSTSDFIRMIRLKKSKELLKTNKLTIAEVAYSVGFNDVKYFSKCFKAFFGKSPSDYKLE